MRVITIQRKLRKRDDPTSSTQRWSIRDFGREFFARENHREFVIEALVFGILAVISAWPIAAAAEAIKQVL